jgi:hypothetical protein
VPELERVPLTHVVASPDALDSAVWPAGAIVMWVAPDEVLAISSERPKVSGDPYAIQMQDYGYAGLWLDQVAALDFFSRSCEWKLPEERPAFRQGAVAGLPAKIWFDRDRVLLMVPAVYAEELKERMR